MRMTGANPFAVHCNGQRANSVHHLARIIMPERTGIFGLFLAGYNIAELSLKAEGFEVSSQFVTRWLFRE
jgi:hypothetical protein